MVEERRVHRRRKGKLEKIGKRREDIWEREREMKRIIGEGGDRRTRGLRRGKGE